MANYNIGAAGNFVTYTDQSGSTLYDSGGSGSNYGDNENFYVLIAPQYATGTLTLNFTSFRSEANVDWLRIYSDIPPTASFAYTGTVAGGYLLSARSGAPTVPFSVTSSTGKAYLRWSSDASLNDTGFTMQWTGSGFYTVDSSSGVTTNKYAANFPKNDASTGAYITFDKGLFTGSALDVDKDIIFGAWMKADKNGLNDTNIRGIFGLGSNNAKGITLTRKAATNYDVDYYYRDNNGTFTATFTGLLRGGQGASATYPPTWNQYGFALRKTSTTAGTLYAYRDGTLIASSSVTTGFAWTAVSSSSDLVLGSYRVTNVITTAGGNTWSGSFDDVFMATVITGAGEAAFTNFFNSMYNSGNWANPNSVITGSFTSGYTPRVLFNWRFEESASVLSTKDYGYYGNIHSASATAGGVNLISTASSTPGISLTAYNNLSYTASLRNATVAFSTSSASVYENTSSYIIGLAASISPAGQSATASINITGSSGLTASFGTDYKLIYAGTTYSASAQMPILVSWADGDSSTKYITASIFDNTTYTGTSSSVNLTLSNSSNVTVGSPSLFSLKILDYEEGYPSLSSSSYSANESDGTASFRVGVTRNNGSNGPLSINYSTVDFTALSGTNYTKTTGTLTWADGDSAIKYTSYIPILYDGIIPTNNPVFQIVLSGLSTGSFSNYPSAITSSYVTIVDQEPGTFNWSVTSLTAYETGTLATVNVNRISGTYGAVTVNISGSSSLGQPLRTTMTGALSFADGVSSQQFTINIQDNLLDESNDIIYYKLYPTASYGTSFTGSQGTLAFTLIDNETGSVTFNTGSYTLYENTSSYIFNIQRLYGGDQAETASISYTGTATENTQYNVVYNGVTQSSPFTITWADQQKDTRYITASVYDNHILDGNRNVVFSINSSSISAIGPTSSFQLNILDYEITGSARFVSSSYSTIIPSPVTIQVERYNGQDVSATAIVDVSGGTAIAGVDYTNIFPYTVTWADQESGSKDIVITTLASWGGNKTLDLKFNSLTNLSSGSILSSSITFINSTVFTQSSHQYSDYGLDFTINKYLNLSNDFTRKTQQVPFSLGTNPFARLKQAYSSST